MLKRILLTAAFLCSAVVAIAQNTMTDVQVLDYVKAGIEQGKSQQMLLRELAARGVDKAQAERVKAMYEAQQAGKGTGAVDTVGSDRSHRVYGEVDQAYGNERMQSYYPVDSIKVFGRDIFRNKSLNFTPSENLATPKNYRLGPGDEVIIDIFGANQVTLRSVISPEGSINVDVLGPLYLSGMTIDEANKYLKRKLSGIYAGLNRSSAGTDIRLSLGQVRSIQVNVIGDVLHAGTYLVSSFATVFHVLYLAGGVVEPGSLRNITVNRAGKVVGTVDVYDFLMNGTRESDIRLEEGDVIMVKPYTSMVKITGEVKRPMSFEMKEGETLQDLLDYAGGFAGGAYTDNVTVVRQNGRNYEVRTVSAVAYPTFVMHDCDSVSVSKLNSYYENRIAVTGAVYQPGTYELCDEVNSVRQLVAKAGGVVPEAFLSRAVLNREYPDKKREVIAFNLGRVLEGKDADILLEKNDELFIANASELYEQGDLKIFGQVESPGVYPYALKVTVEDLIIMAGGLKEGASLARVDIARRKRDANGLVQADQVGELITLSLNEDFTNNGKIVYLEPFDEVTVFSSPSYMVQTHVTVTGEANFPGSFTLTSRNERLSDLVKKSGGVTDYAYLGGARLYRNMTPDERRQLLDILTVRTGTDRGVLDTAQVFSLMSQYQVAIHLDQALANPGGEADIELFEGDVLDIPLMRSTVRVMGSVMMPSVVSFEPRKSGKGYINDVGGYSKGARKSKTFVVHMNGRSERLKATTRILPGDDIVVPEKENRDEQIEKGFTRAATALSGVAALGTTLSTLYLIIQNSKK